MTRKLILDTDGGVDDAQALLLLIGNGRPPDAITTVFGNVDLETATTNVLATLAVADTDIPVHKGAVEPLVAEIIHARHVHGEDGLGGAPRPLEIADIEGADAVGFLVTTFLEAAANGEKVDLLTIGPLTNIALALQAEPRIADGVGQLTMMGGTVYGRGNTTPAAEFNVYADPEAAAVVFAAGLDMVVVPWEPCTTHYMTGTQVDALFSRLPASNYKTFSQSLVNHARRNLDEHGKGDFFRFVDPLAAAVAIEPGIVTRSVRASVDVALADGITRGMTVVDPSGRLGTPAVTLVEEARLDRMIELYVASVGYAP
jgi:purine nucleosidase